MNDWKCPNCGALNDNQSTTACCEICGNSKWATTPTGTELPQIGAFFKTKPTCPDCARLKALLLDVYREFWKTPMKENTLNDLNELEARIKQEGIE